MSVRPTPAGPPAPVDCGACRRILSRFVEGGVGGEEREAMRAHLRGCDECLAIYRSSLTSAARVGREGRERRLAERARARREGQREMALSATARGGGRGLFRLRLALLPALFALLVIQVGRQGDPPPARARWEGGDVRVAGVALGPERPEAAAERGAWCVTGPRSAARVEEKGAVLHLGGRTALRLEDGDGRARVRLQAGSVVLSGSVEVSTAVGVFRLDAGRARLEWRSGELEAACDAGELAWVGPTGSRRIPAGAHEVFPDPGGVVR